MAASGLLSGEDLAKYQTTVTDPLRGDYRGFDITTNHPPGGGVMLLEMLNILEHFDLSALDYNTTDYIRFVCEAMRAATADKELTWATPRFDVRSSGSLASRMLRTLLPESSAVMNER